MIRVFKFEDSRINEALDIATSPVMEVGQYALHDKLS